jgi:glycosyltransferase involved in cell wall biosynthesis
MSRVLVISQLPPPYHGSTVMTAQLVDALQRSGHEVTVVDRRFSRTVAEVGGFSARKVLSGGWLVLRLCRAVARRPDVCIFFTTNRMPSFAVDVAMSVVLRVGRIPRINYIHTMGYSDVAARGPLFRRLVALLFARSRVTVTLGPALVHDVARWVPRGAVRTIPNATKPPEVEVATPAAGAPTVLFLSNLIREKGATDFVRVAAALHPAMPDVEFQLIGAPSSDEYLAEVHELIRELGVQSVVHVLGAVYGADKDRSIADAAVLVFPSTYPYEAQPLSIIESFSLGTPVVAYDIGGLRDLITDGVNGRLLPPGDLDGMTAEVSRILSDPVLIEQLSAGARRSYAERHHPDIYARAWTELVDEVTSGGA